MTLKERTEDLYRQLTTKNNSMIDTLFQELDPLMVAIDRYIKKGEIDADTLKISKDELLNLESLNEKRPGKRRKKLLPVDENVTSVHGNVKIKKEKLSLINSTPNLNGLINANEEATKENTNLVEMPAPSWIPPKKKVKEIKTERTSVRPSRTKGKKIVVDRDSDVIPQDTTITIVTLTDTDESEELNSQKDTRSTKTKIKKQAPKDTEESDTESKRSTRTKTIKMKDEPAEEVVEEKRATRTKTVKKATVAEAELPHVEEESEKRSTRTKTIKKVPSPKDTVPEVETTRSTRTKTNKKAQQSEQEAPEVTRNTRTKTKKQTEMEAERVEESEKSKAKRGRAELSGDEEEKGKKKSKSKSRSPDRDDGNYSTHTVYEDAQCNLGPAQDTINSTFVKEKMPDSTQANATVVVDQPNFNIFKNDDPLLTDDDSIETKTPPRKELPKAQKKPTGKEVFSPYEKTTLKKKVEAFEKLQSNSEIPVSKKVSQSFKGTPASVKQKARMFTPSGIKFLPSGCSTSKLTSKTINHTATTPLIGSANDTWGSASKDASERQKKILEREQALKKKETLLKQQSEAIRKANQEKQIKAQQQRKLLDAEKLKQLEIQKQKEEKLKQREQERKEYQQKQKVMHEKKRMEQKMRMEALKQENASRPIYMVTPLPQLPTADCYDSDDPNYEPTSKSTWSKDHQWLRMQQFTMLAAGERIKNTLFCCHAQTPSLIDIFEKIDEKKLKRSSSQIWRKPPRYTMMPDLNETKFSDDEESD